MFSNADCIASTYDDAEIEHDPNWNRRHVGLENHLRGLKPTVKDKLFFKAKINLECEVCKAVHVDDVHWAGSSDDGAVILLIDLYKSDDTKYLVDAKPKKMKMAKKSG